LAGPTAGAVVRDRLLRGDEGLVRNKAVYLAIGMDAAGFKFAERFVFND